MKTVITTILMTVAFIGYGQRERIDYDHFSLGEKLDYKIKYGWFKIGEATVSIDDIIHKIEGEDHYRVRFGLRTVGWLRIFADLDLRFESYINSETFRPHHATRITINGEKSNSQFDEFTYADSIYVKTYRKEKDEFKYSTFPSEGTKFTDALGTYFYVRALELSRWREEKMRFYIANRIYHFGMEPDRDYTESNNLLYELKMPPIKQFPADKTSYAILDSRKNIPIEIKLSTDSGNFYLILDN